MTIGSTKFIDAVAAELQRRGMSRHEFARTCGIPSTSIRNWFSAVGSSPSLQNVEVVAAALGLAYTPGRGWFCTK